MYFSRKRYWMNAFDGKCLIMAEFDFPEEGEGRRYEYFSLYASRCYNFVNSNFFESVKALYLSEYNNKTLFNRFYYELKISETYAEDEVFSYLISVSLKRGTGILLYRLDSCVFYGDFIIAPQMLIKNHKEGRDVVILNEHGFPSRVQYSEGRIDTIQAGKTKFRINRIKP